MRIEQPEEDEIILLRATLEKGSGVCDMRRDSRRIIRVLGMFLLSDLEDARIDLHRIDRGAVMPQRGSDVIASAGADNHHRWGARRKTERQVIGILVDRFLYQSRVAAKKVVGQVNDDLIANMIDLYKTACHFAARGAQAGKINLLVGRPQAVMVVTGRIVQEQHQRNQQAAEKNPPFRVRLQQGEAQQNDPEPEPGREHQPAGREKCENTRQACGQILRICHQRSGGEVHLPANFLS